MVITEFLKPKSLEEAYSIYNSEGKNQIVGGGAWLKLTLKQADKLISLDDLGLNSIIQTDKSVEIGAMSTLRSIEISEEVKSLYEGILSQACHKIMGINVRNLATIGGSIMGRLSFSDLYPALLVMKAKLVFYKSGEISFSEFLNNPKRDKDILLKVVIDKEEAKGFYKKVALTALDFAVMNMAISKTKEGFQISIGATPSMAALAIDTIKYLNGCEAITEVEIKKANEILLNEIHISDNIRGSKEYRTELVKTYLARGIRQVTKNVG